MSSTNLVSKIIADPPVQDTAILCLIGAAVWCWWKFALAPTVDLEPLSVDSTNIETTVGNKVAQILLPRGECRIDEKWDYILILDESPKVEIEWRTITEGLPSRNPGHYPNFLVEKFASSWYDFWWLKWVCDWYKQQLLRFISSAATQEANAKVSAQ